MDLPSALKEMADMLTIAAHAAEKLTRQEQASYKSGQISELLIEVSHIADQLREIGERIRNAKADRNG